MIPENVEAFSSQPAEKFRTVFNFSGSIFICLEKNKLKE